MKFTHLSAAAVLVAASASTWSETLRATFEVYDSLGETTVPVSNLPSRLYVVDLDLARRGQYTEVGGNVVRYDDVASEDRFFVSAAQSNYVSLGLVAPTYVQDYNLGVWALRAGENVWGSGLSYGSFKYQTRVSLATQSDTDLVQIDGFWANAVHLNDAGAFLTPGAMWTIYDTDRRPDGSEIFGSYRANLVALTAVPEPSAFALSFASLAVLVAGTRSRSRRRVSSV